jgi:dihydropteroate synthase
VRELLRIGGSRTLRDDGAVRDPLIMGVLNVTPDSFSDAGLFAQTQPAVAHGLALERDGAAIVDVGGESSRPGALAVDRLIERERVVPVVDGLVRAGLKATISIDTTKLSVAEAALDAGARYVNDISAFRVDPEMAGLVADRRVMCCLMHMQGEPRTMQRDPRYEDVVDEVRAFLEERLGWAVKEGVPERLIMLDPGIGFGKTVSHNLELLRRLGELCTIGRPIVIGTSRKSFLGKVSGRPAGDRLGATIATNVMALERGASVFRVHDVGPVRDALAVAAATVTGRWTPTTPTT